MAVTMAIVKLVPSAFQAPRLFQNASYQRRLSPLIGNEVKEAELKDTITRATIGINRNT